MPGRARPRRSSTRRPCRLASSPPGWSSYHHPSRRTMTRRSMMNTSGLAPRRDEDDRVRGPGGSMRVALFTGDDVATIAADATIREVAEQLVARDVGLLVVGSPGHVEGVVSERDVVRAIADGRGSDTTHVREVAHTGIVWCDVTATVDEVAAEMME